MHRLALALFLLLAPLPALAYVAGSLHFSQELDPGDDTGWGLTLILGKQIPTEDLFVGAEIGGAWTSFTNFSYYRLFAGPRIAVGEFLVPSAFTHLGYGWINADNFDEGGLVLDAGLGLDLMTPILQPGLHLTYEKFLTGEASGYSFVGFGVHLGISL